MSTINEDELKERLDPLSYAVLREGATERPFTGEYTDTDKVGSYRCKACGSELFTSETKFHSGCGWPSFYAPTENDAVELLEDRSDREMMARITRRTLAAREARGSSFSANNHSDQSELKREQVIK